MTRNGRQLAGARAASGHAEAQRVRLLQGATRPARSQTAAGRMRRRRKHEEQQMTMEREREHLAQVDQAWSYDRTSWHCGPYCSLAANPLLRSRLQSLISNWSIQAWKVLSAVLGLMNRSASPIWAINCGSYWGTRVDSRSSISRRSHARRRQATCKPAAAAICTWLNARRSDCSASGPSPSPNKNAAPSAAASS